MSTWCVAAFDTRFCGYSRPVVPTFLHELPDVLKRALQLVVGVKFSQLKFRCIDNLVLRGPRRSPLHVRPLPQRNWLMW